MRRAVIDRDPPASGLARVASGGARFDGDDRHLYANDASIDRAVPLGVVIPQTEEGARRATRR